MKNELFEKCLSEVNSDIRQEVRENMEQKYFCTAHICKGFPTKEEADSLSRKINAVLNGADVIETLNERSIESYAKAMADNFAGKGKGKEFKAGICIGVEWLKSKIIK